MKAFEAGIYMVVAVLLAIVVLVVSLNFLLSGKVEASSYSPPEEKVECKTNSDCLSSINGPYCMSINGGKKFCGCLDDSDCQGTHCIFNRCET
jgi:hypothetical protein